MRSWSGLVVCVSVVSLVCACAVDNPGWLEKPGSSASEGNTSDSTSASSTGTSSTDTTTTTTTTGLEPLACPNADEAYCPYFVDLVDNPDTCPASDSYVARRNGTTFYRCQAADGACDDFNCPDDAVALDLPEEYSPILTSLGDSLCITVEHELTTINDVCRTRSLVVWSSEDDSTAAPRIILASHTPDAPTILQDDLTVSVGGSRAVCDCGSDSCTNEFVLERSSWCCPGNQVSFGAYTITTPEASKQLTYDGYPTLTTISYRESSYTFFFIQGHDACDGSGFQAGWFMTNNN